MGLHIDIYKGKHDCTLNGVSSKAKGLCITNVEGPFDPCEDYPPAKILLEFADNPHMKHVRIVPEKNKANWTMFGGHYGATSDSRFNDAVAKLLGHSFYGAVPIHDRVEEPSWIYEGKKKAYDEAGLVEPTKRMW